MTRSRKERLKSDWFVEDREKYKDSDELKEEIRKTEQAIKNSTVMADRLRRILRQKFKKAAEKRYDVEGHNYALKTAQAAGYEKAIAEILSLLDF